MDDTQRQTLLTFARETIRAQLNGEPLPPLPELDTDETGFGGAFVTLKNAGRLRGCIGRFNPDADLTETIQKMALAALTDPRFRSLPVTTDELGQITIEISVLSPMQRTNDPLSLELGVHGILIRRGFASGCFLPQVATEQRWTKEQFLSRCCAGKAGLAPDAWQEPDTEVHLFSAEVFGETR
jgi:AmmeMemoRadiSam system protein A